MSLDRPVRIFISAGEISGDVLGGRLISALKAIATRPIEVRGIGGPHMEAEGLKSLFPISELAMMGVIEILPHIPKLKRRIKQVAEFIRVFEPDILVTIDAPGFNKRLADAIGPSDFPKVHYVAPTVWAWRPRRVYSFKARFDRLLCLLPFEPPYFEKVGLAADFVGHAVVESGADQGNGTRFRQKYGIEEQETVLCVLPGSRRGEVKRLLPIFLESLALLSGKQRQIRIVIPCVDHLEQSIRDVVQNWEGSRVILCGSSEKYDTMAAAHAALAASGTVALELAMAKLPAVIAYRINPLTHMLVRWMIKTDFAHLLNYMAGKMIVPEFIQSDCTAENLSSALAPLLSSSQTGKTHEGDIQITLLSPYLESLKPDQEMSPSHAAARAILNLLAHKRHV